VHEGILVIEDEGDYKFSLGANDGGILTIDGEVVRTKILCDGGCQ